MKNETARREIESLDYYLQNHTDDYSEESHTAMMMAVKALEQDPCEDAISRQAVLDLIADYDLSMGQVVKGIHALPPVTLQPKTEWIPVSERLPEDSNEYLVTVINEDVETYRYTGIAWFAHKKDYNIKESEWRGLMIDEKVIAWVPLPTPYDPQERSGEE